MIIVLFSSFFLSVVHAHPFDARVVGHQMEVELSSAALSVRYQLELPLTILRSDMLETKQQNPNVSSPDELTKRLLEQKHAEIADGFKLRLNNKLASWTKTSMIQETLLQEGQFAVFRVHLDAKLEDSVQQVALINQLYMDEQSIFNHSLSVGPDAQLLDTDILPLSENGRRQNFHGSWQSEPWLRELRLSFAPVSSLRATLDRHWRRLNGWPEFDSASNVLLPKPVSKKWLMGTLDVFEACGLVVSVFIGILLVSRFRRRVGSVAIVIGCSWPIIHLCDSLAPGIVECAIGLAVGLTGVFSSSMLGAELLCLGLLLLGMSTGNFALDVVIGFGAFVCSLLTQPSQSPAWLEKTLRLIAFFVCVALGIGLFLY